MNFTSLGQGKNGMNTFAALDNGVNQAVAGFEGTDINDARGRMTPGALFTATPTHTADFTFSWVQVVTRVNVLYSTNDVPGNKHVQWILLDPIQRHH